MSEYPAFPFTRRHGVDPAPENAELRRKCPVSQVQLFDGSKAWLATKHKDCRQVLESQDFSADRRKDGYPEIHAGGKIAALASAPTFVNLDDPEHEVQRNRTQAAFTPSAIAKLRPLIQQIVNTSLDNLISKGCADGPIDLIHNFAAPIPTKTVYHILGVPEEDIENLAYDSEVRNSTSRNAAENANTNLQSYMTELTEKKIKNPGNDLISELISQYQSGTGTKEDISNLAYLVLVAGNAAVINSIALGVLTLHQHPSQLEELKNDPSLAPQVVDEIFRYQTASALNCRRVAVRDVEVGGTKIPKGSGIICAVQAADRDEEFPQPSSSSSDPETFDIHRGHDIKDVLGFGWGIHRCQAEWLSKAELEIVFATLYKRLPNLKVAVSPDELKYTPPTQNIGIAELPVTW
ncbi:Cytochrome P450 55A2 protein [Rutstroemia sp. NJR-2017a BVV2]|nr:Cytochrome P450 55A2 protein [Rutstroemia sp. NJR-2017a BVV2]